MVYTLWGKLRKNKSKSINNVALPDIASNKLRGDSVMLVAVYVCDYTHDEILEIIFSREELHFDSLVLEVEV